MSHGIDLVLTRATVRGQVGSRTFDLGARGDDYVGSLQIGDARMPFVLRGSEQMWAMPAAAQAAILPLLLSCTLETSVIQLVDLRQSDGPPPSPPRWLAPRPQESPHFERVDEPRPGVTHRDQEQQHRESLRWRG